MSITYREETITPDKAKAILAGNKINRKLRPSKVELFSHLIRRGEWLTTHQGIAIAPNGNLLDGQHRLHGIVDSGTPIKMMVARNVDPATFRVIDSNLAIRSYGDALGIPNEVAQVASFFGRQLFRRSDITVDRVGQINTLSGSITKRLLKNAPSHRRYLSASPVRAAAVLSILNRIPEDYVTRTYQSLLGHDFAGLPPVGISFLKQALERQLSGAKEDDLYCRGLIVFNPDNANWSRMVVHSPSAILGRAREQLRTLLFRRGIDVGGTEESEAAA